MTAIRILLADDHYVVRMGLKAILSTENQFDIVAEAADGRQAVEAYRRSLPDVSLIDVRMPGTDGIEAIRLIHAEFPKARMIAMSNYEGDEDIHRALQAGARTYLLKRNLGHDVVDTIRAVHAGQFPRSKEVEERLARRPPASDLSPREFEVLRLVVKGSTNREIAAVLSIGVSTVNTHVLSILGKLGVQDRTQAVTAAIERGIIHLD